MNEPYDPKPRALEPAQNGFIWCEVCKRPQHVVHDCDHEPYSPELDHALDRAEYAESLLCAMAFDHGREMAGLVAIGEWDSFTCIPHPHAPLNECAICGLREAER